MLRPFARSLTINNGEHVKCYVNSYVYKIFKTTYKEKLWTCKSNNEMNK